MDDVHKAAEYYRDVLVFSFDRFWGEPSRFVMDRRDEVQIMLRQPPNTGDSVQRPNRALMRDTFDDYAYVEDVDSLYSELEGIQAELWSKVHVWALCLILRGRR